ncbi:hypothetical protein [Nostoc sp. TCL26-01]|uniref:hypothetical protein n=1 Tax=Nostoc sp. TCL26-01 TaxID=2576904 RepID=UPI0015BB2606|nr:hypothetical protein [Nostoc sp. TCL26-01]QLE55698.1 hypothetical protein FD725_09320 [Nostoc sp. TCL26-01]
MKGKLILLFVFIAALVASYLIYQFYGYNAIWKLWHIRYMEPHFADTRAITSGSEAYALGYDPLFNNVRDPWHRPMNLSRLWNTLFYFRINQSHTTLLGSIFIGSFLLSPFIFIKKLDTLTACVLSLLFISPAVMFGIERATPDLFLFFILSLGIRVGYSSAIAGLCFIIFAGFLKLFPIFGIGLILKAKKSQFWIILAITCLIFLIYLGLTLPDVKQMIQVTPRGTDVSYGANVLLLRLEQFVKNPHYLKIIKYWLPTVFDWVLGGIFLVSLSFMLKYPGERESTPEKYQYIDAFRVGAGIYICTFIFGNNWDYRLMFLIFTIPQIVAWLKQRKPPYFSVAALTLSATILSFWYLIIRASINMYLAFVLDELCNWLVFSGLVYLFISSLPHWLKADIYQIFVAFRQKIQALVN